MPVKKYSAGGQEEQECRGNLDEPGLQSFPFHLHHHSGEAAARRWKGALPLAHKAVLSLMALMEHANSILTYMMVAIVMPSAVKVHACHSTCPTETSSACAWHMPNWDLSACA